MERFKNIGKSMQSYLKRAREQKEFLLKETREFDRGKRHLANMMSIESEEMTQADIDDAIKYLFPSGLFDYRARPMMKHPDLIYKATKDAQFDTEGRPHHHLFYTAKPNYHERLTAIGDTIRALNKYEDEQLVQGILNPSEDLRYRLSGKEWLNQEEMCDKFLEKISDSDYQFLIESLNRLIEHPYSNRARDFIEQLTKNLPGQTLNIKLPELLKDEETGRSYVEYLSKHREHRVNVKTIFNGSGVFNFEGNDILYFEAPYYRRAIFFPLQISGLLDKIDIYARLTNGSSLKVIGQGAIAIAIRYAVSISIAAYVDPEIRKRMRIAGLLTRDERTKERKKPGQEGARRKYTWKKR